MPTWDEDAMVSVFGTPAVGPASILVVDDDALTRTMLGDSLRQQGYQIHLACDGAEALQAVQKNNFSVALLDLVLPGALRGLDVLSHVNQRDPLLQVIIMTASPSFESAVEALRLGAADYLQKPVNSPLLVEKVRSAVDRHRLLLDQAALMHNFEKLFETVPGIVWFLTREGVFSRINDEGSRLLEFEPGELRGKSYDVLHPHLVHKQGVDARWIFCERRTGDRASNRQLVRLRTRTGELRYFEISSTGAYEQGREQENRRALGTLGVGWDVTERVLLEDQVRLAQKREMMGRLASGVAHDFNNILSTIGTNSRLLRPDFEPGTSQRQMLDEIDEAVLQATSVTQQLLMLGRKQPLSPRVVSVDEILGRLERIVRRVLDERIRFDLIVIDDDLRFRVNPGQIEQVLLNLVLNARDAMPGGGLLTVRARAVVLGADDLRTSTFLAAGPYVVVEVQDTGTGMDEEVLAHVFEPYFTTKSHEQGSGLGLTIAYSIVRQHGGHIELQTAPGAGSTFRVLLPTTEDEPTAEPRPLTQTSNLGGGTVLLAEDNPLVRRSLRRALEAGGFMVIEAADGAEALALADAVLEQIDVLVTDVVMPRVDGLELTRRLRERRSGLRVLFISGYSDDERMAAIQAEPNAAFLFKPVAVGQLIDHIRSLLAG